jgi:hypothetical protein
LGIALMTLSGSGQGQTQEDKAQAQRKISASCAEIVPLNLRKTDWLGGKHGRMSAIVTGQRWPTRISDQHIDFYSKTFLRILNPLSAIACLRAKPRNKIYKLATKRARSKRPHAFRAKSKTSRHAHAGRRSAGV